jgi:hypothetical protein
MTIQRSTLPTFLILVLATGIACHAGEGGRTSMPPGGTAAPATDVNGAADFTASDLDAYGKGIAREIEAVRAAGREELKWDTATIPLGAEAAGLPVERYRAVRESVHEVFKTLDFQGKIDGPMQIDLTRVDEATKTRIARDPFTDLTPAAASALRGAMDRLVPIWIQYVRLTAVAG